MIYSKAIYKRSDLQRSGLNKINFMIKHIVFFRLLDEAEGKTKLENALIIRDGLLALKDKIDVLVEVLWRHL